MSKLCLLMRLGRRGTGGDQPELLVVPSPLSRLRTPAGEGCGAERAWGSCPPHGPRHFLPKGALVTTPSRVISVTLVQSYRGTGLMSFGGNE